RERYYFRAICESEQVGSTLRDYHSTKVAGVMVANDGAGLQGGDNGVARKAKLYASAFGKVAVTDDNELVTMQHIARVPRLPSSSCSFPANRRVPRLGKDAEPCPTTASASSNQKLKSMPTVPAIHLVAASALRGYD